MSHEKPIHLPEEILLDIFHYLRFVRTKINEHDETWWDELYAHAQFAMGELDSCPSTAG